MATELISKIGQKLYDGSAVNPGIPYQNIPGMDVPCMRDKSDWRGKRIGEIAPIAGNRVLDLGCSVGTIASIFKNEEGASYVLGVDHDEDSLNVAKVLYEKDVEFWRQNITLDFLETIHNFDVVVWISQFMWMVKQHGMEYALDFLFKLSQKCETLVFETAGNQDGSAPLDITQEEIMSLLVHNTCFQRIRDFGPWSDGWAPRNVFVCDRPKMSWNAEFSRVDRIDRKTIRKTYSDKPRALELKAREEHFLELLKGTDCFPQVVANTPNSFDMNYCGLPAVWIPEYDCIKILVHLKKQGITHRDIQPSNVLWDGTNCVLIDFAYAVHSGDITNYHYDLGGDFKCPQGYNDEFSMRKTQFYLMSHV